MKKSSGRKEKSARKKSSHDGSGSSLKLKKQVDLVNKKAQSLIEKMASDPNTSLMEFHNNYQKVKKAFEIMNGAIELGEQMKKLKDGK